MFRSYRFMKIIDSHLALVPVAFLNSLHYKFKSSHIHIQKIAYEYNDTHRERERENSV